MNQETNEILHGFYQKNEEDQRLVSKTGNVEFIVTVSYIDRYLKKGDRILEVGCGTGRYSLHYAHLGYEVDAVELFQENLDVMEQHILPGDRVRPVQGNALDLSIYPDETFDMTLVLGPLYHLFTEEDKLTCMQEAYRVTKRGGLVYFAYCQFDASMMQAGFGRGMYDYLVENGLLDTEAFLPVNHPVGIFAVHRKEEIDRWNEQFAATRLHYVGTDMFTHYYDRIIDQMDDRLYGHYLDYVRSICENQQLVGVSNHVLDILRKN